MPLTIPRIDDRNYQQLRDEAIARIPVHNPEWTNFNASDPGITLVEAFAFLAESLLYRANQIPERNRLKFLQLLDVPLASASAARGIVTFANERGLLETVTLPSGTEVQAGKLPYRLERGLDVLPVEARLFTKRELKVQAPALRAYYEQLYDSFLNTALPASAKLYEAVPLDAQGADLADTVDQSLWVALLARKGDPVDQARAAIAARTLTLGVVPWLASDEAELRPGSSAAMATAPFACFVPDVPAGGELPPTAAERVPRYRPLPVMGGDVLTLPGTLQVTLPAEDGLRLWTNLDPLESGVGDFPPPLDDTALEDRVITWLRLTVAKQAKARVLWAGINAAMVSQRERVLGERLPPGTGAPDQVAQLARRPVLPGTVRLEVTPPGGERAAWQAIADLYNAGAEVPVPDPRLPPGAPQPRPRPAQVFRLEAEAGELRFGDGLRGARPPFGAALVADYEVSEGREGNVNAGAIKGGPTLPPGFTVTNPVATWGGADAETVAEGEKQVQRLLQHRDRMVSAADFEAITWRTPGVEIGRVDVVPASSPELGLNEPGDAPGAVTLLVLPRRDPAHPDAPVPDRVFLDAVCRWIEPRRLVTTEVFLRGADYVDLWLSVGIEVASDRHAVAEVREAVEQALRAALAPVPPQVPGVPALLPLFTPSEDEAPRGWPLRRGVVALELAAVVARVAGVSAVRELQLARTSDTTSQASIPMRGLQLPRVAGIMVSIGPAMPVADVRGTTGVGGPRAGGNFVPVPVVPEEC